MSKTCHPRPVLHVLPFVPSRPPLGPRTLATRATFAVAVGVPVGVWSALASMPGADTATLSCSAAGAAGTYSFALMILLESAMPRPAALSMSRTSGGPGGRRRGGGIVAGSILVELYVAVVASMPLAAIAQVSYGRAQINFESRPEWRLQR